MWSPVALASLLFASPVLAGVQEIWWNMTYVEDANPDGLFNRRVVGINNTWPIPVIDVSANDSLIVHATNSLDDVSTLHHHGMFFNSTSWMDGALQVSECGIPPGGQFDYVVPINSSGQWGTYWGQYVDGLRGPVVIHPSKEVYSYDEEFTIILADWYHEQHDDLLKQFISISNPGGAEPVPDSGLIYFAAQNGSYLGPISGTSPAPVTSAVGFNENATLPFEAGKTYRLRILNTGAFSMFYFWIDGHEMRIIEVDGTDIEESPADLLSITVAQRYSVLVTARNDTNVSNWAIHANMDVTMFDTVPDSLNPNVTSSITYSPSASLTDLGFLDAYADLNDTALVPVEVIAAPTANKTIDLEVIFDTMDDGTNRAMFNQITYTSPLVPAMLSALSLGDNATVESAYTPLSFVVDYGDVVDITIKNGDAGKHPFHLHGHKPMIVGRSEDYTSDDPLLNPPIVEGQANPMRRDTVHVPSMSSITLRVVADNPGTWFLHCHIEWHLQAGLAITLIEAPLVAQQRNTVPQAIYDNCKALNTPFSGNAAGHESATDLSGLTLGPFPQKLGWHSKGIGAMAGCVLTALIGMLTVVWYSTGGYISEEEIEHEVRESIEAKAKRGKFFGLLRPKQVGN
ncbi:related to iron transport multicopper oxidase [Armillaria ostoyae]|uniref:Related to iron transport multicopper oxidase n=1 Tax=Armillaria ostoyae TaxID=47428 RepID=A0A284S563_ARMOS|nr:related to iron transport multicopper oxidase [Armillaria ostoyae]